MLEDLSGWLWLALTCLAVAALGGFIAYGAIRTRRKHRDARMDALRAEVVKRNYQQGG